MEDGLRVLTIEDESTVRRSIVAYLEDSGFEMIEAENGRIGLERFHEENPDLVLCDLRMPEMDGLKVLAQMSEEAPETPFIIVSGTGDMRDAIQALKLGAWDYITKPIQDMAVLEHAVHKAIERARLVKQNREYREHLEESLRRLEEDESAARRVQFNLLPDSTMTHNGYQFDRYLKTSAFLSGDFVDYFMVDEKRLAFYIADVSGHGVSSAFVTVLLSAIMGHCLEHFRQGENDDILHPERVLKKINDDIFRQNLGKYLTMFYAVIDEDAQTMTYSNGGQFPCPVLFDGQEARFIEQKSLPVGLFEDAEFRTATEDVPQPFALAMFSDGVLEILEEDSLSRQKQVLLNLVRREKPSMEAMVEALGLDDITMPLDDITLLLVEKGF